MSRLILDEEAITGLEILVTIAIVLILGVHIVFNVLNSTAPPPMHVGLLPITMQGTADQLNVYGSITGFSAVSGLTGNVQVVRSNASVDRLGGVAMTLSVFIGDSGGVDMAKTEVLWIDHTGTETISLTRQQPITCPGWAIMARHNQDTSKPADDDDILEPGELFDIFICPTKTYAPYEEFTVVYDPPGAGPRFPVECSVPSPVTRIMVL